MKPSDGVLGGLPRSHLLPGELAHVVGSGYLYCFANDAWGFYGNNRGYVTLTVTCLTDKHA